MNQKTHYQDRWQIMTTHATLLPDQETGLSTLLFITDNVIEQFKNTAEGDGCVIVEEH